VHEGGYRVEQGASGPRFFRPDGREVLEAPPAPGGHEDRLEALGQSQSGLPVSPWQLAPTWTGGAVDYGWAVASLLPRTQPPRSQ
jgi:hypothetical protein